MCDNEAISNLSKSDSSYTDRGSNIHSSSSLSYPPNVTLCYPAQNQLSPLADGQSSSYLVPPSMASPSGCLAMAPQQMYTNYPSPYYRSMLSTQQGYYSSILSPAGHHPSSAFYGTFYNHSSSPVYPAAGQAPNMALTPMNYYSPTLYMQNHESHLQTVWNGSTTHTASKRATLTYDTSQSLPSCSKTGTESTSLEQSNPKLPEVPQTSLETCPATEERRLDTTNLVAEKQAEERDVADEDGEDKDDLQSDVSCAVSTSSAGSRSPSPQFNFIERELAEQEYLPDASFDKFEATLACTTPLENFPDQGLQCLLCKNIDHLLPRPDILDSIELIIGHKIPSNLTKSVLICTQCDLILERYSSLEKEIDGLKLQIKSMYEANREDEEEDEPVEPETESSVDKENSSPDEIPPVDDLAPFHRCPECGKNFLDPACLARHLKLHAKDVCQHLCEQCGQGFRSKFTLKKHIRRHEIGRPVQCAACQETFHDRAEYVKHRKEQCTSQLLCDTCGKAFPHRSALQTHLRLHSGERPFSCTSCGKSFNVKSNLVAHLPKCTGQMPYRCAECDKSFSTKHLYETHVKAHAGQFAVKCDICGMGFAKRSLYVAHQRTHTKEKPYLCHVCGRGFSSMGNCNSHAKTHTDERNFVCEICGKKFARKTALEAHLNRHKGHKPFQCNRCNKAFSDASNLLNHQRTHKKQAQ